MSPRPGSLGEQLLERGWAEVPLTQSTSVVTARSRLYKAAKAAGLRVSVRRVERPDAMHAQVTGTA